MACCRAVALSEADARLADKQVAVAAAKSQLAAHDKHLLSQDATIAKLLRKQVCHCCCFTAIIPGSCSAGLADQISVMVKRRCHITNLPLLSIRVNQRDLEQLS